MTRPYVRGGFRDGGLSSATGEYRLYRFWGHDGALLYIGVTGRMSLLRLSEHLATKPWAGEIAGWQVDPRIWSTEADVLTAEKAAIYAECPRYNTAHNGNNPHRVAVQSQRRGYRQPVRRRALFGLAPGWWAGPSLLLAAWLIVASALWWAGRDVWIGWDGPRYGGIGAALILTAVWTMTRPKRRRRR